VTYTKADLLAKVMDLISEDRKFLSQQEATELGKPINFAPTFDPIVIHEGIQVRDFIRQLCIYLHIGYVGKFGRLSQLRKELSDV
jgi:hypothetical protein